MINAKFVPLKYYTLSSQLQRLTSFSVGCSCRRILSTGQIAVMRKWSIVHSPSLKSISPNLSESCYGAIAVTSSVLFSFSLTALNGIELEVILRQE